MTGVRVQGQGLGSGFRFKVRVWGRGSRLDLGPGSGYENLAPIPQNTDPRP